METRSEETLSKFWNRRTLAVVTGASRGIGRVLVEKLSSLVSPESALLLLARSEGELNSLRALVQAKRPDISVTVGVVDLSKCDEITMNDLLSSALGPDSGRRTFDHAVCAHNVGSLGDATKRCSDLADVAACVDYLHLNVASVVALNAVFLRLTAGVQCRTVVNISSLCGIKPFPYLSLYCTGKAARDMFFQVLAREEPAVRVLNYAPGPVETDMRAQLLQQVPDDELKAGGALSAATTCDRLLHLLARDRYVSGSHVDYFDPATDETDQH